ncbi:MAG TPA: FKBP-type peptidyl-prolyl cis-trans isomerase [Bacteroidota bacterium]|nr:FKBP-type peptidyl-prolyl cis-trans isomerase [Bacteroidota bacterium]
MKALMLSFACMALLSCQGNTQDKVELKTQKDSVSYSIGTDIGKNLKAQQIDVDPKALARGISDVVTGAKAMLTDEQIQACMTSFQRNLAEKATAKMKELGEKNKKEGDAFLATNKTKEGVKTTASGLQYKVEKMGTGPKPTAEQTVVVNYKGTLIDGAAVDDSYKRGGPATFPMKTFMQGLVEGLQLMPTGSKFTFYIPPEIGYGPQGAGEVVPPNATLIFDVELVAIK